MSGEPEETPKMLEFAFRAAKEFGLPCVLLGVVIYLFREAAITVHGTVLVPVVESHTRFIESTQETLREISTTQERQAETLREIAIGQHEIQQAVTRTRAGERVN
jgi:hypothetical protein